MLSMTPAAVAKRKYRKRRALRGGVGSRVPNDRAIAHVERLRKHGWTHSAIFREINVRVDQMTAGGVIYRDTERLVLALDPMELPKRGRVPVRQVRRHVKALQAAGWQLNDIAEHAGIAVNNFYITARGEKKAVNAETARRILSIELPPPRSEDVDEVVVFRLMDPHRDKPQDATPAEIKQAIGLLADRFKVDRKTASLWVHHERWKMKGAA